MSSKTVSQLAKSVAKRARDEAKAKGVKHVLVRHRARRVASRVLISKKAPDNLIAECQYWTKELGRKLKAQTSLSFTRQGGCQISFTEDWGGYSIEAHEIGNVIVWSSGRDKAANLPREIEKLAQKSKRGAMALYRENSPSVSAREVAYRYAMEHANEDALKKYLKDHPDADKSKHTVKKDKGSGSNSDFEPGSQQEAANDFGMKKNRIEGMASQDLAKFLKSEDDVALVGVDKVTKAYEKHKDNMEYDEMKALKSTAEKLSKWHEKVEEVILDDIKEKIGRLPHGAPYHADDLIQYVKGEEDNLGEKLEDMDKYQQISVREYFPKGVEEKYKKAVADSKKWKDLADGLKRKGIK